MEPKLLTIGSLVIDRIDGTQLYGGSGANVAVNAAILGLESSLLTAIAKDSTSVKYVQYLEALGVDIHTLEGRADSMTYSDYSVAENGVTIDLGWYENGLEHAFSSSSVPTSLIQNYPTVHLGSCVAEYAYRVSQIVLPSQILSYNPGGWIETHFAEFTQTHASARFLFLNEMELAFIQNQGYVQRPTELLSRPEQLVIVTRGKDGADLYTQDVESHIEALRITPVEETGAGDAFATAFLWAIVQGYSQEQSALLASLSGALAVQTVGGHFSADDRVSFFSQAIALGLL